MLHKMFNHPLAFKIINSSLELSTFFFLSLMFIVTQGADAQAQQKRYIIYKKASGLINTLSAKDAAAETKELETINKSIKSAYANSKPQNIPFVRGSTAYLTPAQSIAVRDQFASLGYGIEEDIIVKPLKDATDPYYRNLPPKTPNNGGYFGQYKAMEQMRFNGAWDRSTDCSKAIVAIFDTGIESQHPDLQGALWTNPKDGNKYGYSILAPDPTLAPVITVGTTDEVGHGTHTAGIVGAVAGNGKGGTGGCWSSKILPIKMMTAQGGGLSNIISSINFIISLKTDPAIRAPIKVISMSFGYTASEAKIPLQQAILDAQNADILIVASAGNDRKNSDGATRTYPASTNDDVLSVAAVNYNDTLASFSNYGVKYVKVAASGVGILSTVPGQGYAYNDGTSMSAPFVSALAALISSNRPELKMLEVSKIIQETSRKPATPLLVASGGIIDAAAALNAATQNGKVTGTVKNSQGTAIGGATVNFYYNGSNYSTQSDSFTGAFTIAVPNGGPSSGSIGVSLIGYVFTPSVSFVEIPQRNPLTFVGSPVTQATASIYGRVISSATSGPISGAAVILIPQNGAPPVSNPTITSAGDGSFNFPNLPYGKTYLIKSAALGYVDSAFVSVSTPRSGSLILSNSPIPPNR